MSGILHCKHHVKLTEILCVKDVNCLHDRDRFVQRRAKLWHRAWCFGMCPEQSWTFLRTQLWQTALPPSPPVLGLLGSAARPGTPHGLVPDQSTARLTCCPSPHLSTDQQGCRRVCFQLNSRDSQAVTQTLLYCSLHVFLAVAVF